MISRLTNPHTRIASACRWPMFRWPVRRWMLVPLLVITLALATTVAIQSDTAYADTGTDTETISDPMGDPADCWWIGLPCILF